MVETENLRTASAYINNQLLARGLLRDGQTIDFAGHGKCEDVSVTAGRIISVVNDLILRRDRDAENRESLSITMRSLRAENAKCINDISKLEEKNAEAQRKLEIATAAENAARTQLKSAESTARGLKDQLARTKALVAQARASCATEVRRRDRQIDTLKKQLGEAGRARGARPNPAITTITITGNFDAEEPSSPTKTGISVMADEYSLRGESTVTLAELSRGLSEENEAILALMSQAMEQLREMSGWDEGRPENTQSSQQPSLEDMSSELDSLMEHMRHILNNPSFVPIEEVVVREEEINRLKEGWVKMETRWKDAMLLIDGWRKRMAAGGSPIREDELKLGFRLGSVQLTGTMSGAGDSTLAPLPEETFHEDNPDIYDGEDLYDRSDNEFKDYENGDVQGEVEEEAHDEASSDECEEVEEQQAEDEDRGVEEVSQESTPLPEPPKLSPLRKSSSAGNRGSQQATTSTTTEKKQTEVTSRSALPERTQRSRTISTSLHLPKRNLEQPSRRPTRIASRVAEAKSQIRPPTRVTSLEEALLSKPAQTQQPETEQSAEAETAAKPDFKTEGKTEAKQDVKPEEARRNAAAPDVRRPANRLTPHKRFLKPTEPLAQQSPLTMSNIAAKLAASEADAARVRAKLQAARSSRSSTAARPLESAGESNLTAGGGGGGGRSDMSESQSRQISKAAAAVEERDNGAMADDVENVDPAAKADHHANGDDGNGQQLKVQKRKRDVRISSKKTSRRRSTLSPMELETLISGTGP